MLNALAERKSSVVQGVDVMNICHVIVTPSADAESLSSWGSR
ncbi:hypothetical protein HMPREF9592_02510 [Cutibacterium acnes HL046PA1]|nr:hypothetical protein HMPREF9592_02510 [Cutibacterium acnes HL046PA1]